MTTWVMPWRSDVAPQPQRAHLAQHGARAAGEAEEQLLQVDVEGEAAGRGPAIAGRVLVVRIEGREAVDDVAVRELHALGLAGGAGGVEQVGEVLGAGAVRRRGQGRLARAHVRGHQGHVERRARRTAPDG